MASLIWMSILETKRHKLLVQFKIKACLSESKLIVLRWKVSLNAEELYVVLDNILLLQPALGLTWFSGSDAKELKPGWASREPLLQGELHLIPQTTFCEFQPGTFTDLFTKWVQQYVSASAKSELNMSRQKWDFFNLKLANLHSFIMQYLNTL